MRNLIDCKKTDLHFDYKKPTIFQYFRVRAGQTHNPKNDKKALKNCIEKELEKTSKNHEKYNQKSMKNPSKKPCKKRCKKGPPPMHIGG